MAAKPVLPNGYLGAQPKFQELGLCTCSHCDCELEFAQNDKVEISFKYSGDPVKITHQLINTRTEEEVSQFVFTQSKEKMITFVMSFPTSDWYKFQIFALDVKDESKSLPNVFNYLINCSKAVTPVFPFPKQYAQWKENCYLTEPMVLHDNCALSNVKFDVTIPGANAVAVVADGEWFHLDKAGGSGNFKGTANLLKFKGKDTRVTVNANLVDDETKYSTLLEYRV